MVQKADLERLYKTRGLSMKATAEALGCSVNTVVYWMDKYAITRRSRSDANYLLYNPGGDPFKYRPPDTSYLLELQGMGRGLYWGEGTKSNKYSVRLGNSDINLINTFIEFLVKIYCIDVTKLKFTVQIFNDTDPQEALKYWSHAVGYGIGQFTSPIVTNRSLLGTYSKKSKYGVLTVCFHNTKLRDILVDSLPKNGVKYQTG